MTYRALADQTNLSAGYLNHLVHGNRPVPSDEIVRNLSKALGVEPAAAEVAMLPQNYVKLEGKPAQQMVKLMEALEEHEDTKKVWSNADIEEKEIEASLA